MAEDSGFRIQVSGLGAEVLGFRFWDFGSGVWR